MSVRDGRIEHEVPPHVGQDAGGVTHYEGVDMGSIGEQVEQEAPSRPEDGRVMGAVKFTRAQIAALADAVDFQIGARVGDEDEHLETLHTLRDRLDHSLFETTANYQRVRLEPAERRELRVSAEIAFSKNRQPRNRGEAALARSLEGALAKIGEGAP